MSYSVNLTEHVVKKLYGWRLPKQEIQEIRRGLDALSSNPKSLLMRVGPPHEALQYDVIVTGAGNPRRDSLYTFTVRYGSDERTLFVVDCELIVENRTQ
jgi:hypothetical protein